MDSFGEINDNNNGKYDFMDFIILYYYFLFPKKWEQEYLDLKFLSL